MAFIAGLNAQAQQQPAEDFAALTQKAKDLVAATEIASTHYYCVEGKLTCRTVSRLKDKVTGLLVPDYIETFSSTERAVASTSYFTIKSDGKFEIMADDVFDGKLEITRKNHDNDNLIITFDENNLPTVHNLVLKVLGTSKMQTAVLSYSLIESRIEGTEIDTNDPSYQVPKLIVYKKLY